MYFTMKLQSGLISFWLIITTLSGNHLCKEVERDPSLPKGTIGSLTPLNVDPNSITLSGFSSGAAMAQQLFVSYSSMFKGCASISGAFYRCSPGNGDGIAFDKVCTNLDNPTISQLYNPAHSVRDIENYANDGLIEDPVNLKDKRFYVFAGTDNYLFNLHIQLGSIRVFEPFIKNRNKIRVDVGVANLTLPTDNLKFPACAGPQGLYYGGNCGFSAAFEALKWIMDDDASFKISPPPKSSTLKLQTLQEFNQTEFFFNIEDNLSSRGPAMDDVGYIYIPSKCHLSHSNCPLHIYFHGCWTGRMFVGPNHIYHSGYLEVAETNGIITLFPQATLDPVTKFACWDTYGFASMKHYATKAGVQMTILRNMLNRILEQSE